VVFIGHQILNFERGLNLAPEPQISLVPPAKFLLEALDIRYSSIKTKAFGDRKCYVIIMGKGYPSIRYPPNDDDLI